MVLKTTDIRHHTTNQVFTIVKCNNCGLVYLNPQPEKAEIAAFYPNEYIPHQNKRPRLIKKSKLLNIFFRINKKNWNHDQNKKLQTVLDIGCGSGKTLEKLRKDNPNWIFFGIETNPRAAATARNKGFEIIEKELLEAHLPENHFSLILIEHVLEHVTDPKAFLKEVNRILNIEGEIRINVPNFRSFDRWLFGKYWQAYEVPRHLYLYTEKTIRRYLEESSLKIQKITFHSSPKYFIESFSLWKRGAIYKNYQPIVWLLLFPLSKVQALLGFSSTMKIAAKKL